MEQGVLGSWHLDPAYPSFLTLLLLLSASRPEHAWHCPTPGELPQVLASLCDLPAVFSCGPMARLKHSPLGKGFPAVTPPGAQQTGEAELET